MVEREKDIDYLNRFMVQLWPGISDILRADVTHRAFKEAKRQPGRMSRRRTRLDLLSPPQLFLDGDNRFKLRLPGSGSNRLSTRIYLLPWIPYPRILADVDLSVEMAITPDADPDVRIDGVVHSNMVGNLVDRWFGWKENIRRRFAGDEFKNEIGYFGAARYAPSDVPEIPEPDLVYPDRPILDRGVNVVLVPESFSESDLPRFDQTVEAVIRMLSLPNEAHANEPFHSFKTAWRVWTLKPEQSPEGDHVMGSFLDPRGHRRVALANLARLAAVGRAVESAVSGVSILVFVVNPRAPRFGDRRPTAMALGNVILQPLQGTPEEDAYLLLHEMGHTSLAYLGDEYVLRSRSEEEYLGRPLGQPNLTSDPHLRKWQRWLDNSQLPPWDEQPIVGVEGAGYFGTGIWRPAEKCAMRHSKEGVPYCAVCREAMTNGIRNALLDDQFLIRLNYPSGDQTFLKVAANGSEAVTEQITLPDDQAIQLSVTLVASTLPEPWEITTHFAGAGDFHEHLEEHPESGSPAPRSRFTFAATAGDSLRIQIQSKCPFTPWDPIPDREIELHFVAA
jgi:hypothetical protein